MSIRPNMRNKLDTSLLNVTNTSINTSNLSFLNQSANQSLKSLSTSVSGGDRFIPCRKTTLTTTNEFLISNQFNLKQKHFNSLSPKSQERSQNLEIYLGGKLLQDEKILKYRTKAPEPPSDFANGSKILFPSQEPKQKINKAIASESIQCLDAPFIRNDFYLNLLDWGCKNLMAVALDNTLYLWDAGAGSVEQLCEENEHLCSVSWSPDGNYLAIGDSEHNIKIWDVAAKKKIRTIHGHVDRVSTLAWRGAELTAGSRTGDLIHQDLRQKSVSSIFKTHAGEVCGIKWCPSQQILATGGNDNKIQLRSINDLTKPLFILEEHKAAIKALEWCPWKSSLLLSAGGMADNCIRSWNAKLGTCINVTDSGAQTTSIIFNKEHKEFVTAHGYPDHQIKVWNFKTMTNYATITGHTMRILGMTPNPDETHVATCSADETIRIWKIFDHIEKKKKLDPHAGMHRFSLIR